VEARTPPRYAAFPGSRPHQLSAIAQDIIETAKQLRDFLAQMVSRLLSARAWLREGSTTDTGFAQTPDRDGHTYILPGYASAGRLMSPLVLIHESFHDLDRGNVTLGVIQ